MKFNKFALALIALSAYGTSAMSQCSIGAYENNNTIATASTLSFDIPIETNISPGDVDYYKITVPSVGFLSISLAGFSNDLDLQLLNTDGTLWSESVRNGATAYESVQKSVPGGPNYYIVRVAGKNTTANTCYKLLGFFTNQNFISSYEPNETFATAKDIYVGNNVFAGISTSTDEDWYKFQAYNLNAKISIFLNQAPADLDLELYDLNGVLIASSTTNGSGIEFISYTNTSTSPRRLRVFRKSTAPFVNIAGYLLRVHENPGQAREESTTETTESAAETLVLYPNPATAGTEVTIPAKGAGVVRILNSIGEVVSTQQIDATSGTAKVSLAAITPGIYMIDSGEGNLHRVVVK